MTRAFLIGAPRSGTTFLYALLCSHPAVMSIPETGFFEHLSPKLLQHVLQDGYLAMAKCKRYPWYSLVPFYELRASLRLITQQFKRTQRISPRILKRSYIRDYIRLMDKLANLNHCATWIEKTPNHVFFVEEIGRAIPQAKFIHLLRKGEDVAASWVHASISYREHLDKWTFCQGLPWIVAYWNSAVRVHLSYAAHANHIHVFYEDLITDLNGVRNRLLRFLNHDSSAFDPSIPLNHVPDLRQQPWKASAMSRELLPAKSRVSEVFGPEVRQWLHEHLLSYVATREAINGARELPTGEGKLFGSNSVAMTESKERVSVRRSTSATECARGTIRY